MSEKYCSFSRFVASAAAVAASYPVVELVNSSARLPAAMVGALVAYGASGVVCNKTSPMVTTAVGSLAGYISTDFVVFNNANTSNSDIVTKLESTLANSLINIAAAVAMVGAVIAVEKHL